ncbi:MAG TPA: glycosyltransferase family 9 protein [Kofleriaceae bacterium]|nr:glycosyltransferase family 9 protein [Kofleriaceae bacterium]
MRVLIVRLGAFGDIVHTLPLAADLAHAGHRVSWVCEDRWAPLVDGSSAIERVFRLPRRLVRDPATALAAKLIVLRRLARELRAFRFDAVVDAQGLAKSAALALASGAKLRFGHCRPRAREGSWLVTRGRSPVAATHVIDQQRALGLALTRGGGRGPWRFPLPPWRAERDWARDWLARKGLSAPWMLNVGAGWPTKVWPKARQVELVRACRQAGQPIVLVWGTHEEHDLAEEIAAEAGGGVLAPPTTIPQLGGLLAAAGVVISGDTGPLHLALALGTPAVGLFGPVPAERNGPRGRGYRTLQAPGAAWERRDVAKVDMGAISAGAVVAAARAAQAEAGAGAVA